ncbi:MAG: metal ABC transporter ATP-binding protein [Thaumarchaeota archaeon]|nr:metal ABC transporter ATP-binding protein [Nitrososphaerota archaeon]
MLTPIVDVENLTVQFGDNVVVDNVSVSVGRGEILGVLGPNGAGKSCMLRAMLGLLPYRGRVSFFGTGPEDKKHILPLVGYVPQKIDHEPLFPATVHDIVSMGVVTRQRRVQGLALLERSGLDWRNTGEPHTEREMVESRSEDCQTCLPCEDPHTEREMVESALETVGLSPIRDRRIGELSGGQRQRVFIAQSLVRDPLLMIMDEPVSNMDVESQSLVYSAIRQAARKHKVTVIISMHDLDTLREHTNAVMFLNRSLIYHGDTDAFFADRDRVKMYTEASMHAGGHTHGV